MIFLFLLQFLILESQNFHYEELTIFTDKWHVVKQSMSRIIFLSENEYEINNIKYSFQKLICLSPSLYNTSALSGLQ